MTIIKKIKANHGNQEALLELANKETLYKVANHFQVSPAKAAPKVAQRLFNAQSITIKGNSANVLILQSKMMRVKRFACGKLAHEVLKHGKSAVRINMLMVIS